MDDMDIADASQPDDDEALEAARAEREGQAWLQEYVSESGLEAAFLSIPPSTTPMSPRAFDLIVEFEVSSKKAYEAKYRRPIWPEAASGVTIGIGYDVGYASKGQLWEDWKGAVSDEMIAALEQALGVQGKSAKSVAQALRAGVDVPWDAAISVHRAKVIPRWVTLVERSLSKTGQIGPGCLGALVSLTYNRGASFGKAGDRYEEMRAIKQHMANGHFGAVPADLRAMKRLWPTLKGLQTRREREAKLFEDDLAAMGVA